MANKHSVVQTDLMLGTYGSVGLVSLQYHDNDGPAAIDNGHVVLLDSLIEGEREIWKAVTPAKDSPLSRIAIVATPEVMYDERLRNLSDFYNEAGNVALGYRLDYCGQVLRVSSDALSGTAKVGDIVELQPDSKLKVVTTATEGSTVVGRVVGLETVGTIEYVAICID